MKKHTKKILCVGMALALFATMAVPTFAASAFAGRTAVENMVDNTTTLNENTTSGNSTVWFQTDRNKDPDPGDPPIDDGTVTGNYTVTVPTNVLATKDTSALNKYEVRAEDVLIHPGKKLDITCTYNGTLKHTTALDTAIAYKMQKGETGKGVKNDPMTPENETDAVKPNEPSVAMTDFNTGDVILSVAAGKPFDINTVNVCAYLTASPLFAGMYKDTATFKCAVVDAA